MRKTLIFPMLMCGFILMGAGCATTPKAPDFSPKLEASLAGDKWDGQNIPQDEVCNKFNSRPGNSPAIRLENLPASTTKVRLRFNDETAGPAFDNGGHGIIEYRLPGDAGNQAVIPSIPGQVSDLPEGFSIERNFTSQAWDTGSGYLPPCSGGEGNLYTVDIQALNAKGELTGETKLRLGRY
jgi:hypothetical protein